MEHEHVDALQITSDLAHERHEWLLEHIGWGVMALVLLAALLGLFGSGPLARAEVGPHAGPLWIEYNRFERKLSPSTLRLHITPAALRQGALHIQLGGDYARAINVVNAIPAPSRQEINDSGVVFIFDAPSLQGQAQIDLQIYPGVIGRVEGSVGLEGTPSLTFAQFIYP